MGRVFEAVAGHPQSLLQWPCLALVLLILCWIEPVAGCVIRVNETDFLPCESQLCMALSPDRGFVVRALSVNVQHNNATSLCVPHQIDHHPSISFPSFLTSFLDLVLLPLYLPLLSFPLFSVFLP